MPWNNQAASCQCVPHSKLTFLGSYKLQLGVWWDLGSPQPHFWSLKYPATSDPGLYALPEFLLLRETQPIKSKKREAPNTSASALDVQDKVILCKQKCCTNLPWTYLRVQPTYAKVEVYGTFAEPSTTTLLLAVQPRWQTTDAQVVGKTHLPGPFRSTSRHTPEKPSVCSICSGDLPTKHNVKSTTSHTGSAMILSSRAADHREHRDYAGYEGKAYLRHFPRKSCGCGPHCVEPVL